MNGWTLAALLCLALPAATQGPGEMQQNATNHTFHQTGEAIIISCTSRGPTLGVALLKESEYRTQPDSLPVSELYRRNRSAPIYPCCFLKIRNVSIEGAGLKCALRKQIEASSTSSEVRLHVLDPPILWNWKQTTYEAISCQGGSLELVCHVSGYPTPTLQLPYSPRRLQRDTILIPGQHLVLRNTQPQSGSSSECRSSPLTSGDSRDLHIRQDITLVVEFAPVIHVPNEVVVKATVTEDCLLKCVVQAYPHPIVSWLKEGTPLDDTAYTMSVTKRMCTTVAVLRVSATIQASEGNYTCVAENRHGKSSAILRLLASSGVLNHTTVGLMEEGSPARRFNVTGFIIGMLPPIFISLYIIVRLGYRSRYAEERAEEEGRREEPFFVSY